MFYIVFVREADIVFIRCDAFCKSKRKRQGFPALQKKKSMTVDL